jgi:hypothetical protein
VVCRFGAARDGMYIAEENYNTMLWEVVKAVKYSSAFFFFPNLSRKVWEHHNIEHQISIDCLTLTYRILWDFPRKYIKNWWAEAIPIKQLRSLKAAEAAAAAVLQSFFLIDRVTLLVVPAALLLMLPLSKGLFSSSSSRMQIFTRRTRPTVADRNITTAMGFQSSSVPSVSTLHV